MERNSVFQILGIEETKEETLIRKAYQKQLSLTHPEENPEGFKRLRQAYEQALKWAKEEDRTVDEEGQENDFLRRVEQIYSVLDKRLEEAQWEELVRNPGFDDLDSGEKMKWEFFSFLAAHYRLPSQIWKILDKRFNFTINENEFREYLPSGFVDFLLWKITREGEDGEFFYEALSGDPKADYDGFINDYYELTSLLLDHRTTQDQEGSKKKIEEKIAGMDSYQIFHPWFSMYKARYKKIRGEEEEAIALVLRLWEEYPKDRHLRREGAILLSECGRTKEAEEVFLTFLEGNDHQNMVFDARVELSRIYLAQNRTVEAREQILEASEICRNDIVEDLLTRINNRLIEEYRQKEEALTGEESIQLAWAHIQTETAKEGYSWMKEKNTPVEDSALGHRAWAILSYFAGRPREALEETRLWQKMQSLEEKIDRYRKAQSFEIEGRCLTVLYTKARKKREENEENGQAEEDKRRKQKEELLKRAAIRAFNKATDIEPEVVEFQLSKMHFYREIEDYVPMLKTCEKMIRIDPGFYWGPFFAQEACEKLKMAQEVIDYFYQAKSIYDKKAEIYERAARVFAAFGQYNDMENILNQAKEAEVESQYFKVKYLELWRKRVKTIEDYREVDDYAARVIAEFEVTGKEEKEWLAEVYLQRAYLQDEMPEEIRKEETLIYCSQKAVELNENINGCYFLGRSLLRYRQDYEKAYEQLSLCERLGMRYGWLDYYLARCEEALGEEDRALSYYKEAMEELPEEIDIIWRVGKIYLERFTRTGQKEYYDKAKKYLDLQTEKFGFDAEDRWMYTDLYIDNSEHTLALEQINEAMKVSQDPKFWGRKGQLLRLLKQEEEALSCLEKSIELFRQRGVDYLFGYFQAYELFKESKKYKDGIIWIVNHNELVKDHSVKRKNIIYVIDLYTRLKDMSAALMLIGRLMKGTDLNKTFLSDWDQEAVRIEKVLAAYENCASPQILKKKAEEAGRLLEGKKAPDTPGRWRAYMALAKIYSDHFLDDEKSLYYYQKAAAETNKPDIYYFKMIRGIMGCLWRQGKTKEASSFLPLFWERAEGVYGEARELNYSIEELYLRDQKIQRSSLYTGFLLALYSGEVKKAEELFERLREGNWCSDCIREVCTEELLCQGYLSLQKGDMEKAEYFFGQVLEADDQRTEARRELERIRRKKKGETGKKEINPPSPLQSVLSVFAKVFHNREDPRNKG